MGKRWVLESVEFLQTEKSLGKRGRKKRRSCSRPALWSHTEGAPEFSGHELVSPQGSGQGPAWDRLFVQRLTQHPASPSARSLVFRTGTSFDSRTALTPGWTPVPDPRPHPTPQFPSLHLPGSALPPRAPPARPRQATGASRGEGSRGSRGHCPPPSAS